MTFNKTLLTAALVTVSGFAAMSSVNAADTSTFGVSLKLTATCSVDASKATIVFAEQKAATDANAAIATSGGDIEVICSKDAPYIIALASKNITSTTGAGQMNHEDGDTNKISYQLYSDDLGANVWGSAGDNRVTDTGNGLSAAAKTHKVYAKLLGTTDVLLGDYSDTVTASITY